MAKLGIFAHPKRKFKVTTDSKYALPIAENLLACNFLATEPDRSWVADITYIWTSQCWLYVAVVIDLFSRMVVGWSMAEHMCTDLVLTALQAALGHRTPANAGLVFHSDRGSQYASADYQSALQAANITCSMSRKGNCWDNAVAESFFGTLKTEFIYPRFFFTREIARTFIAEWIEAFTTVNGCIPLLATSPLSSLKIIIGCPNLYYLKFTVHVFGSRSCPHMFFTLFTVE
jgi:putative transposase